MMGIIMRLTQDWIDRYDEQGFLVFPGLLDAAELEVIDGAIPDLLARDGDDVVREDHDPSIVRMVFGAHFHQQFRLAAGDLARRRERPRAQRRVGGHGHALASRRSRQSSASADTGVRSTLQRCAARSGRICRFETAL